MDQRLTEPAGGGPLARWGRPAPVPAEGEVAELVALLRAEASDDEIEDHLLWMTSADARRAADLLEQCHPAPVPVAERLPGPEDCDGEGRCWWLLLEHECDAMWCESPTVTHWLPATALPLPAGEVQ